MHKEYEQPVVNNQGIPMKDPQGYVKFVLLIIFLFQNFS